MNTAFVSGALFASLIPSLAMVEKAAAPAPPAECENLLIHEPLVIYERSGATLTGLDDQTLIVYADGSLMVASASTDGPGGCVRKQVDPATAAKLQQALAAAGAFTLCDDDRTVTDVPLRTLTVLRGDSNARGRTFSYWIGDGDYAKVDVLVEGFIADQFPGL